MTSKQKIQCLGYCLGGRRCRRQVAINALVCHDHLKYLPETARFHQLPADLIRLIAKELPIYCILRLQRVCSSYYKALSEPIFWRQLGQSLNLQANPEQSQKEIKKAVYRRSFAHQVHSIYQPVSHFTIGFIPGYRTTSGATEFTLHGTGIPQELTKTAYTAKLSDFLNDILVWYQSHLRTNQPNENLNEMTNKYRDYLQSIGDSVKEHDLIDSGVDNVIEYDRYYFVFKRDGEFHVQNVKGKPQTGYYLSNEAIPLLLEIINIRGPLCKHYLSDLYPGTHHLVGFSDPSNTWKFKVGSKDRPIQEVPVINHNDKPLVFKYHIG